MGKQEEGDILLCEFLRLTSITQDNEEIYSINDIPVMLGPNVPWAQESPGLKCVK